MKRMIFTSLAALTLWGGVGLNFAAAQFGTLGQAPIRPRPTVSPYINEGFGNAGTYYGVIRPQIDANRSIYDLQQGLSRLNPDGSLQGQLDQNKATTGLQTGHAATYFNYSHYYPVNPASGTTSAGIGYGPGLGGFGTGSTGLGTGGLGAGGLNNIRTFYGPNLAQPLIRP